MFIVEPSIMTIVCFWYGQLLVFTVTIKVSVSYYEGDRVFVGTISLPYNVIKVSKYV